MEAVGGGDVSEGCTQESMCVPSANAESKQTEVTTHNASRGGAGRFFRDKSHSGDYLISTSCVASGLRAD